MHFRKAFVIFLSLLFIMGASAPATTTGDSDPGGYRLLIYYGIPEGINGLWDPVKAASLFAEYDYIVFGEGLEDPQHSFHKSTSGIISTIRELKPRVRIYGYIDLDYMKLKRSLTDIKQRTDKWRELGADGIFLDDAGYDYGSTRIRFNEVVRYIHDQDMSAFVNAWKPDDVMSSVYKASYNSRAMKTAMDDRDIYLLEDFLLPTDITKAGSPSVFSKGFKEKMDKALYYRNKLGIRLMSISDIDYGSYSDTALRKFFRINEAAAGVFSLDGYGIAPTHYSASKPYDNEVRSFPYIENYRI